MVPSPTTERERFIVIDERNVPHEQVSEYLTVLALNGRTTGTLRKYAGHLANFLNYCQLLGVDWTEFDGRKMSSYVSELSTKPFQHPTNGSVGFRTQATANEIARTVVDFLTFATEAGTVSRFITQQLHSESVVLVRDRNNSEAALVPILINKRAHKLPEVKPPPVILSTKEVQEVLRVQLGARDRFLVSLLAETGLRVGEALGLLHRDLHFLMSNSDLGCRVEGPHLHVSRRINPNGARAKSRYERHVPVSSALVHTYHHLRDDLERQRIDSEYVFVVLQGQTRGAPMQYQSVHTLFVRISKRAGFHVRPHLLRHHCATQWKKLGANDETVSTLLGHRSLESMQTYVHPSEREMREAIETPKGITGEH